MISETNPAHSGHEIGFAATDGGKVPFSKKPFEHQMKVRTELGALQREFLRNPHPSQADVDKLVDALISYDRLRAGTMWRESSADALAKKYRRAIPPNSRRLDLSSLADKSSSTIRLPWHGQPGNSTLPFDPQKYDSIDLNKTGAGTFFEKWFYYTGAAELLGFITYELFEPGNLGGIAHVSNTNPGPDDSFTCIVESGVWFTYVPKKSGYLECAAYYNLTYGELLRDMYPVDHPGETFADNWIHGSVRVVSGDNELGGSAVLIDNLPYRGDGRTDPPNVYMQDATGMRGFRSKTGTLVAAGQPIHVLIGIRVKIGAAIRGPGINFARSIFARSGAIGIRINDTPN